MPSFAGLPRGTAQPNVLVIVVDDLRPALGCYGDPHLVTPNIDQLASRSARFTRAYTQQAVCGPSRTSFLTGRRPETVKLFDNVHSYWRTFAGNFTTLPQHFKENGYFTASVGKVFHPGKTSGRTDDYPYSWSQQPYHPPTQQYRDATVCPGPGGRHYRNVVCPVRVRDQPGGSLPDIQSVQFAVDFLHNRTLHKDSQPFFLAVGLHKPHLPLKFPEEYLKLYPLSEIHMARGHSLPPKLPEVSWNPWMDLRRRDDVQRLNVSFPYGPLPPHYQRLVRQSYFAATSYMDNLVGELLGAVDQLGLAANTIITFLSDHGWSLGEHQEWSKFSNFEVAVRVPLILYVPGVTTNARKPGQNFPYLSPFQHGTRAASDGRDNNLGYGTSSHLQAQISESNSGVVEELVELVDLFPTLSELAGLAVPPLCPHNSSNVTLCVEGLSLASLLKKPNSSSKSWKTAVFSQYPRPSVKPENISDQPHLRFIRIMGYTMRTHEFRYTEWVKYNPKHFKHDWSVLYGRELYDHRLDSQEDNNVADNPEYSAVVSSLSAKLHAGWRKALPV